MRFCTKESGKKSVTLFCESRY